MLNPNVTPPGFTPEVRGAPAITIENAFQELADVTLEKALVGVAYDPAQSTPDDLVHAVAAAGDGTHHVYQAKLIRQTPTPLKF